MLDDGVIGDKGLVGGFDNTTSEEERSFDEHPPFYGGVLLDDLCVDEGDEEDDGKKGNSTARTHSHGCNIPSGLLVQAEVGGSFVDDGQGADGTGDQEPERRAVDCPWYRILADVHDELDEHKDGSCEAGRDDWSHTQTCENGTHALTIIPSPL